MLIAKLKPFSYKVNASTSNVDGKDHRNISISYSVNSDDDVSLTSEEEFSTLPKEITFYIDGYTPKMQENSIGVMSYHKANISSLSRCRMWASISQKQFDQLLGFSHNDKMPTTIQIEAALPELENVTNENRWDNLNYRIISIVSTSFTITSSDEDIFIPAIEKEVETIQKQLTELISVSTTIKYALATIAIGLFAAVFLRHYGIL